MRAHPLTLMALLLCSACTADKPDSGEGGEEGSGEGGEEGSGEGGEEGSGEGGEEGSGEGGEEGSGEGGEEGSGDVDVDGDGSPASLDCDDGDASVHPGADEICDEDDVDEDCDALADNDDPDAVGGSTWYRDGDGDGYGLDDTTATSCDQPPGYASSRGDCDDTDAARSPGAPEVCDDRNIDENCNDLADDADVDYLSDSITWYKDSDGDGYGTTSSTREQCDPGAGWSQDATDCDDSDNAIHPGGTEVCDDRDEDEDCDGLVDDADSSVDTSSYTTWYVDSDSDGYGTDSTTVDSCKRPTGYDADDGDCDDSTSTVSPGRSEVCDDGVDNNCDGGAGTCALSGTLNLSTTAAEAKLYADSTSYYLGAEPNRMVGIGDTNGDGAGDLVLSMSGNGSYKTSAWLYFGPTSGNAKVTSVDDVTLQGSTGDCSGDFVAALGDVDADGQDDWAASAYRSGTTGEVYVYLTTLSTSGAFDTSADITITGGSGDYIGSALARAGDLNGDGYDDLLYGSQADDELLVREGPALSTDVGTYEGGGELATMSGGGDVDGDGYDDVLLADLSASSSTGAAYLMFGPLTGTGKISAVADATLTGEASGDMAGHAIGRPRDVDGDGYADLLITAPGESTVADNAGAAYLVLGPISSDMDLGDADSKFVGIDEDYYAGESADLVDFDGTGQLAVVVGSVYDATRYANAGAVYVIYPSFAGTEDLDDADYSVYGESSGDKAGVVTNAGDNDGDGIEDLLIGAEDDDQGDTDGGAIYLVLGEGL